MPALLTSPPKVSPFSAERTSRAALMHRSFISDVEQQRREIDAEFLSQSVRISLLANAAKDSEASVQQHLRGAPSDAGRDTGDDDGFHARLPCVE